MADQANEMRVCKICDPNSDVPHVEQVTRFKVANLCCAGEERIIRSTLESFEGIAHVAVNIVGRYIVVKHCPVDCCAPIEKIISALNEKRLGVSIQEVSAEGMEKLESLNMLECVFVFALWVFFVAGLIASLLSQPDSSMALYLIGIGLGLVPILRASILSFQRRTIGIHALVVLAVVGAIASEEYFDASLVISLFISAELLESIIMLHVRNLLSTQTPKVPKFATLANGKSVPLVDIKIGDIISVRAGESILADGEVLKGEGVVDESSLTGESLPISKARGSNVLSGTLLQNGYIEVLVQTDSANSTLQKLTEAMYDVQADKGRYAKMAEAFALYWTPLVIFMSFTLVIVGGGITGNWPSYVNRGIVLLVLACPCAIVIGIPIPAICAIVTASKYGVLIRGSSVMENLSHVNSVAVDKTGTLSKGFFKVNNRLSVGMNSEDNEDRDFDPMLLAASLECKSTHPLANAIVSAQFGCVAEMEESALLPVQKLEVLEGVGISGWVTVPILDDWRFVLVGNERILRSNGGNVRISSQQSKQLLDFTNRCSGESILLVAVEDELELLLSLSDELRAEAKSFVASMAALQLDVTMLTGDQEHVAREVCKLVGIAQQNCHFRLLPSQKCDWIRMAQSSDNMIPTLKSIDPNTFDMEKNVDPAPTSIRGKRVLMIGDGMNDSSALAAASVGLAMGSGGSAMAVAAAGVVILSNNLLLVKPTILLSRFSWTIMVENCIFALAVKIFAIVFAILGRLQLWEAIVVDIGSLIVVVFNGLRPLYFRFEDSNN